MVSDVRGATGSRNVVKGDSIGCFRLYEFGVEGGLFFNESCVDFSVGAESVDFGGKSHVTQFSQGSIDEMFAAEVWKEHLQVVISEPLSFIEARFGVWFGVSPPRR